MNKYMKLAIEEAKKGILDNQGGPFGSIIVKDGEIIGKGHNQVVLNQDPTCHGEIQAIKNACENLKTFDLSGCDLYTTGEPCHMCLSACLWANINKVYYGCTIADNADIGFRDEKINQLFGGRDKLQDFLVCIDRNECVELFNLYKSIKNKTNY